jgi:hypothetical protein
MPGPGSLQRLLQGQQLLLPSHEAGEPPCRTGLQAAADGTGSNQLKDFHRFGQSPDRKLPQGIDLDQPFGESERSGSQPNTTWRGELFHTRRQMRGLADSGIIHMQAAVNRPHHDFPRVEPDARQHLQAMGAAHLFRVAAERGLHRQGGITGPHGVVFMRHGGTEQGHDAIAQHLVHCALKAVHGVHHDVQRWVQERTGFFRVEALDQLGRALEVGKQHGHLLALAF